MTSNNKNDKNTPDYILDDPNLVAVSDSEASEAPARHIPH